MNVDRKSIGNEIKLSCLSYHSPLCRLIGLDVERKKEKGAVVAVKHNSS